MILNGTGLKGMKKKTKKSQATSVRGKGSPARDTPAPQSRFLRGLYAGTFDPLTIGHLDIIERATRLCDELVVVVAINKSKASLFSTEERLNHIEKSCRSFAHVRAIAASGLIVDTARSIKAQVLIRGLRTEADYTYEMQMASMNRVLNGQLETIFIPTTQQFSHISSTLVKEVASLGGSVKALVPPIVYRALSEKYPKKPKG